MASVNRVFFMQLVLAGLLAVPLSSARSEDEELRFPREPGERPVCEASAALVADCPGSEDNCLLVGDNEIKNRLFLFRIDNSGGKSRLVEHRELRFDDDMRKIEDIEALVRMPSGDVRIYGSHGRNKTCERDKKRYRFARVGVKSKTLKLKEQGKSDGHSCKHLFGKKPDAVLQAVCTVVERTEARADNADSVAACNADPAFNIEGAVFVPGKGVWIGLRAPLVDGKAVLLRQNLDTEHLSFDAAAFLELDGAGIRELTVHDGRVLGIAGSAIDSPDQHALWHFDVDALEHGATITPAMGAKPLPNRAEGLAVSDGRIWVLMDGDKPESDDSKTCIIASTYQTRELP